MCSPQDVFGCEKIGTYILWEVKDKWFVLDTSNEEIQTDRSNLYFEVEKNGGLILYVLRKTMKMKRQLRKEVVKF